MVEILYESLVQEVVANPQGMAGIDFGVENLVTIVNNIGLKPLVVKGKVDKAVNQWFNKGLARLGISMLPKESRPVRRYSGYSGGVQAFLLPGSIVSARGWSSGTNGTGLSS